MDAKEDKGAGLVRGEAAVKELENVGCMLTPSCSKRSVR